MGGVLQGGLGDGPDSRIYLIDSTWNGIVWWANYNKNGQFDTTQLVRGLHDGKKSIMLNDPVIDCLYDGEYENGLKHGQGYIQCRIPSNINVFDGEWRNNLPFKNRDTGEGEEPAAGNVILYSRFKGSKIFEGSIRQDELNGKLYGYASFYDAKNAMLLYEGNWSAPCLSAVLFVTFDLEFDNVQPFLPKFTQ